MKHINSINEFFYRGEKIDKDYIKSVFIDFIENGANMDNTDDPRDDDYVCEVNIPVPQLHTSQRDDIDKMIKHHEEYVTMLMDIKSCLEKVKDEFPEIKCVQRIGALGDINRKCEITIRFEI